MGNAWGGVNLPFLAGCSSSCTFFLLNTTALLPTLQTRQGVWGLHCRVTARVLQVPQDFLFVCCPECNLTNIIGGGVEEGNAGRRMSRSFSCRSASGLSWLFTRHKVDQNCVLNGSRTGSAGPKSGTAVIPWKSCLNGSWKASKAVGLEACRHSWAN